VAASGLALAGEAKLDASRRSVTAGRLAAAAADAGDAAAILPWSAEPRLQEALVSEREGRLAAAQSSLDAALRRSDEDWRLWVVAARVATRAGDIPRARSALRRAGSLNPRSPLLRPTR
jgi:Tfp pilus assembly protein PilF